MRERGRWRAHPAGVYAACFAALNVAQGQDHGSGRAPRAPVRGAALMPARSGKEVGKAAASRNVRGDHWYGHAAPNDPRFHLDHPFPRPLAQAGPNHRFRLARVDLGARRVWFAGGSGWPAGSRSRSRPESGPSRPPGAGTVPTSSWPTTIQITPGGTCSTTPGSASTSMCSTWGRSLASRAQRRVIGEARGEFPAAFQLSLLSRT